MSIFKLILIEKRNESYNEKIHEKFIKAKNRDKAYDKALKTTSTFFDSYGMPDKDMIFWYDENNTALWIKSLEKLKIV